VDHALVDGGDGRPLVSSAVPLTFIPSVHVPTRQPKPAKRSLRFAYPQGSCPAAFEMGARTCRQGRRVVGDFKSGIGAEASATLVYMEGDRG